MENNTEHKIIHTTPSLKSHTMANITSREVCSSVQQEKASYSRVSTDKIGVEEQNRNDHKRTYLVYQLLLLLECPKRGGLQATGVQGATPGFAPLGTGLAATAGREHPPQHGKSGGVTAPLHCTLLHYTCPHSLSGLPQGSPLGPLIFPNVPHCTTPSSELNDNFIVRNSMKSHRCR
ncbi:hypothetical protein J6590_023512 [Homalodisca vitripennis]|nr:hypothetical protein J6590_023512 [Homalodisca vitripennis]